MDEFYQKIAKFAVAIQDVYRDEEDRDSVALSKLELTEDCLTEDFTAMLYAMSLVYSQFTNDTVSIIEFTHILNSLAVQQYLKDKGYELEE